jgi:hypothetical protein
MRLEWIIEGKDVERVRALMTKMAPYAFVGHWPRFTVPPPRSPVG